MGYALLRLSSAAACPGDVEGELSAERSLPFKVTAQTQVQVLRFNDVFENLMTPPRSSPAIDTSLNLSFLNQSSNTGAVLSNEDRREKFTSQLLDGLVLGPEHEPLKDS